MTKWKGAFVNLAMPWESQVKKICIMPFRGQASRLAKAWAATTRCATGSSTSTHQGLDIIPSNILNVNFHQGEVWCERSRSAVHQQRSTWHLLGKHGPHWPAQPILCFARLDLYVTSGFHGSIQEMSTVIGQPGIAWNSSDQNSKSYFLTC